MVDLAKVSLDDDFASAFENLAKLGDAPVPADLKSVETPKPAAEAPVAGEEPVAEAPVAGEEPVVETPAEGVEPVAETPPEPEPVSATPELSDDELARRLGRLLRQSEQEDEPARQRQPEQPAPQPQPEAPLFSDEEQTFLTNYHKEWPDVAKAEMLLRRSDMRQLAQYIFTEVSKAIAPDRAALQDVLQRMQYTDLRETIDGYDTLPFEKIKTWVGGQPAYLQAAYNRVIEQGTSDEVADLISRYKAANPDAPVAKPTAGKTPGKGSELQESAKQAAAALAPVGSKRTVVVQEPNAEDFESAFAAAAAES